MPRLLLLAAALPLASAGGLRGKGWPWDHISSGAASAASKSTDDIFGTKSDSDAPTGDFMDQYIAATHKDGADTPKVWFRSDDNQAKKARAREDLERPERNFEPFRFHADTSADDAMSKIHEEASRERASRQAAPAAPADDASDAPAEQPARAGPPMVTKRIEGGGSSGGGAVVDVHLDSELQESLLQGKAHSHSRNAPDVEAEVTRERFQDVYIHDGFAAEAAQDVQAEAEVRASKDLKA